MRCTLIALLLTIALFPLSGEDPFGDWPAESGGSGPAADSPEAGFDSGFSAYGYVKSSARLGAGSLTSAGEDTEGSGALTTLRLKGDWEPEALVSAHVEINFETSRGYLSPYGFREASGLDALAAAAGEQSAAELQAANPQDRFHSQLTVDHAWGLFSAGPLDLKLGKLPVAWGTAYAFNPLDRVNSDGDFGGAEGEETPGSTGILPALQLGGPLTLSGYLVYEEKSRSAPAGASGGNPDNYPFGLKLQGYRGPVDWSLAFVKEVLYLDGTDEYRRRYYLGGELFTAVGDGGLYAEAVCRMPGENGTIDFSDKFEWTRLFEVAAGGEYTLEGGTTLRVEYYFHGAGAEDKDDYQPLNLLSGELAMLGRHYLFAMAGRSFIDYLEVHLAALANLSDGSWVLLPEVSYALRPNVELTASGLLPWGPRGSELDGRFDIQPGVVPPVDLVEGGLQLEAKVSF